MNLLARRESPKSIDGREEARPLPLPGILRACLLASLAMFALMLLAGYVLYRLGYPPPHYNPLGGARYEDLMEYVPTFKLLHTTAFFRNAHTPSVAYPPFAAVLFSIIYSFAYPIAVYLSIAAVWLGAAVCLVGRALARAGLRREAALLLPLMIALVSFPIAGLLQRGNLELFVWIFAAAGIWAYVEERNDVAAILWALAAATKLYPVIFFALLLPRRSYRALAVGIGTFVTTSVLSMAYLGPSVGVAWKGSLRNVFGYQGVRVSEWSMHELAANHSVFGLAKLVSMVIGFPLAKLTLPYYALGAVVFGLVFFGRLVKFPVANQLLAVSVFMVMLPPVSYFYTLVHLYVPLVLLIFLALRASRAGARIPGLNLTLLLFVPLFSSFILFTYPRVLVFGGLVQAALLVWLFLCSATFPFQLPRDEPA